MTPTPAGGTGAPLVERSARRIAGSRSVVLGLGLTLLLLGLVGGFLMHFADRGNFPTYGISVWWAVQTFTTVGYGDVVPTTTAGRLLGGLEMLMGVSFVSFLTASVTTVLVNRASAAASAESDRRAAAERAELMKAIDRLEAHLSGIEQGLAR